MTGRVYELTAPRSLVLRDDVLPDEAPDGRIVAETEFTAVSPGTELAAWNGKPPLRPSRVYPRVVGYCNVAQVVSAGAGVSDVAVGDYVLTHQSHRTAFHCAAPEVLLRVDGDQDLRRRLVCAYLFHLGYAALLRGNFRAGEHVAVVGIGTLGLATAALLKTFGAEPLLLSGNPATRERLRERGFAHVFDKELPAPSTLRQLTSMDGVDLVIDTSDAWDDYELALRLARGGGTVVCLGFPGRGLPPPSFNPLDPQYLYDKQLTLAHCGHVADLDVSPADVRFTLKRNLRYLASLLERGTLDPSLIVGLHAPWRELADVYRRLEQTPSATAVLEWRA